MNYWVHCKDYYYFYYHYNTTINFDIIIRVRSAFLLVAGRVLLKYTRTDDVNGWHDLI